MWLSLFRLFHLSVTPAFGHRPAGHFRRGRGTRDSWHCQRDRRCWEHKGEEAEESVASTRQCSVLTSVCISARQMEAVCPLKADDTGVIIDQAGNEISSWTSNRERQTIQHIWIRFQHRTQLIWMQNTGSESFTDSVKIEYLLILVAALGCGVIGAGWIVPDPLGDSRRSMDPACAEINTTTIAIKSQK